jgi:hypothetical protein
MAENFFQQVKSLLTTPIETKKLLNTPIPLLTSSTPPKRKLSAKAGPKEESAKGTRPTARVRQLEGELIAGQNAPFAINGTEFSIDSSSWVIGELKPGSPAKAKVARGSDGKYVCQSIRVG